MPRNVTVVDETPVTVTLVADPPTSSGGLEIKLWMVKYGLADEAGEPKKLYFQTGMNVRPFYCHFSEIRAWMNDCIRIFGLM